MCYTKEKLGKNEDRVMAITIEELEVTEKGFVELMKTFDLTDEEIATNLGYKLVAE